MKKKTKPKAKQKITKTRSKISTKQILKRKNPILISDDQKIVTFEELLAFSDSETRSSILYLMEPFDNIDSATPLDLIKMISYSLSRYDSYGDFTKHETDLIAQFQKDLSKLPKHLIIELPDYERSEKIYSKTLDRFGKRKPGEAGFWNTIPLHWKRPKHS